MYTFIAFRWFIVDEFLCSLFTWFAVWFIWMPMCSKTARINRFHFRTWMHVNCEHIFLCVWNCRNIFQTVLMLLKQFPFQTTIEMVSDKVQELTVHQNRISSIEFDSFRLFFFFFSSVESMYVCCQGGLFTFYMHNAQINELFNFKDSRIWAQPDPIKVRFTILTMWK